MKNQYILAVIIILLIIAGWYFYSSRQNGEFQPSAQISPSPSAMANAPDGKFSFFLTSVNPGKGGDLGGLAGADQYCQSLASSAGAGNKTWRAYLSTQTKTGSSAINARDRIGSGPWYNYKGELIANNIQELHNINSISKQTALSEKGEPIKGRGETPNWHDILTGSDDQGRAVATTTDTACGNWTVSLGGSAIVGHHDRMGLRDDAPSKSWNFSHYSRGCSLEQLQSSGGGGLFYCFAAN